MLPDLFNPLFYFLEKASVGKVIPDATAVPNRKLLKDYPIKEGDKAFDHSVWSAVLQRHVTTNTQLGAIQNVNVVDYAGVSADDDFQAYLELLAAAKPDELAPVHQLAFWINAYNALCINHIVSHEKKNKGSDEPLIQSINNLSQPHKPVWDLVAGQVGGQDISLNEIEHEKLRKQWAEPAVHGCIVCASASCPNLRNEAFVAERLEEQMKDQMRDWMSNTTKGLVLKGNCRLEISRIFLWFEKDFGGWEGIREWIPQFISDEQVAKKVRKGRVTLRYFGYDWSINRLPAKPTEKVCSLEG